MAREKAQPNSEDTKDSGQSKQKPKKGQNNNQQSKTPYQGQNREVVGLQNDTLESEERTKLYDAQMKEMNKQVEMWSVEEKHAQANKKRAERLKKEAEEEEKNKVQVDKVEAAAPVVVEKITTDVVKEMSSELVSVSTEPNPPSVIERQYIVQALESPQVQQGAMSRLKGWFNDHPRIKSLLVGAAAGGAVKAASKITMYAAMGANFPATVIAGAVGGGIWEGIKSLRKEAMTYQSKEILQRFNSEPDFLKRAAMLTEIENLMKKEQMGGNDADFQDLRVAVHHQRAVLEADLAARDGAFANHSDKDKIGYILNLSKGVRGGLEGTARGREAERLMRDIKDSLEFKRDYGNALKNRKGKIGTAILRGAAYGALGGAIGGAVVGWAADHVPGWFGGGTTARTVLESRPKLQDQFTETVGSKGITGASREGIHDYITDRLSANPNSINDINIEKLVYAEDYLKDRALQSGLGGAKEISFSAAQIEEALNHAGITGGNATLTEGGQANIAELIKTKAHFLSEATKERMLNFATHPPTLEEYTTIVNEVVPAADTAAWTNADKIAVGGIMAAIIASEAVTLYDKKKGKARDEAYYQSIGSAQAGTSYVVPNLGRNDRAISVDESPIENSTVVSSRGNSNEPTQYNYPPIPKPPGTPFDISGNGNPFTPKDESFLGMKEVEQTSATSTAVRSKYREEGANQTQVEDPRKKKGLKPIDANFEQDLGSILGGADKEVPPIPKPNEPLPGDSGRERDEVIAKKAGPKITYQGVRAKDTANVEGIKNGFNEAYPVLVELGIKNDIDISFYDQNRTIDYVKGVFHVNMPPALKYTKKSFDKLVNEILNIKTSEKIHEIEGVGSVTVDVADMKEFVKLSPGNRYKTYDKIATALSSFTGADKIKYLNPLKKINIADYSDITADELSIPMFLNKDGVWTEDEDLSVEDIRNMIIEARSERMLLGTSLENEAPDVTERNMNKAELFRRFPNVVAGPSFNKLSLEVRKRGVLNFINSAKEFINGFPYDVKIKLGNKTDVQDGVLQLDISKDRDGISKDLHAGLRLARKKFLLENSGKEVKVEKFEISNEETGEILENIKDTGKGTEDLVENSNTALEKTEPVAEEENELSLQDWLSKARSELGEPTDQRVIGRLRKRIKSVSALLDNDDADRVISGRLKRSWEKYSKEVVLDEIKELVNSKKEDEAEELRKGYDRKFNNKLN